jgi:hypothetical protein
MISPAINPSRNGTTLAKGTANVPPPAGTPSQSPAARSVKLVPHDDGVVSERHPLMGWGEIGERAEELHLIGGAHRTPALASEPEGICLLEGVWHEGVEDSIDVPSGFRFPMSLEEPEQLVSLHFLLPSSWRRQPHCARWSRGNGTRRCASVRECIGQPRRHAGDGSRA